MSASDYDPVKAILQHYFDDTKQYAEEHPEAVSLAQTQLAFAALDLGFVLETDELLAKILESRLADMGEESKGVCNAVPAPAFRDAGPMKEVKE